MERRGLMLNIWETNQVMGATKWITLVYDIFPWLDKKKIIFFNFFEKL